MSECGLSKDEVRAHEGELLSLHDTFKKVLRVTRGEVPHLPQDEGSVDTVSEPRSTEDAVEDTPCGSPWGVADAVDRDGLRSILLEYGLMFSSDALLQKKALEGWLAELLCMTGGFLRFKQVLEVVRNRR